jgi:HK97 family phage portal protein
VRSLLGSLVNRTPIPYTGTKQNWYGGPGRKYGVTGQMDAMGANATLFAIVNRTSTAVAAETWHLHRRSQGGVCEFEQPDGEPCGTKNVVHVPKHPAQVVLDRPNDFYTTAETFESGQQHVDLTGEGWLVMPRIGGMPAELWVARPDRMVVVTDPRDFLVGYIYAGPDGHEVPLKRQDVLLNRMPSPLDPYRGLGPVQTIMQQVAGTSMSAEWNTNFFRNGARPGGIIKLSRRMTDPEFDQLVERFNLAHKGVANAGRTAFLEDGEWQDVKPLNMRDMQFVETAELNRDTVLLAYGMSKFAVGVVDDVNRAVGHAVKEWFGETIVLPRLNRWRGLLNSDFLPQFPGYDPNPDNFGHVWFVHSNPVPADRVQQMAERTASVEQFVALVGAGVKPAVAAEVCNLPELPMEPKPEPQELPPGKQPPPGKQKPPPDEQEAAA